MDTMKLDRNHRGKYDDGDIAVWVNDRPQVSGQAIERCKQLRKCIEARAACMLQDGIPASGDIAVIRKRLNGKDRYTGGFLSRIDSPADKPRFSVCTQPYTPHAFYSETGPIRCIPTSSGDGYPNIDTSGGYWFEANRRHIKECQGQRPRLFWTWQDLPRANGGAYFRASVNVWLIIHPDAY